MAVLLETKNLKKDFDVAGGKLHAVDDISFSLEKGKTLGVVGESGCGKSTLGRMLIGLINPTSGEIYFNGKEISSAAKSERKALRREMQMIFQDPLSSLDPRMCTAELIAEPLDIFGGMSKEDKEKKIDEIMELVGISRQMKYSYPHELDGGRRQRIGIARALALDPAFIVCDEPVSALDVSIQAQVLNLLKELQKSRELTYMFITHDLSVVRHISDDILVMYMGQMVEMSGAKELFKEPLHPYTKGLLSAIPVPSIHREKQRIIMKGEITAPVNLTEGCRFAPRCPYASEICHNETPVTKEKGPGHFVACHLADEINR